MKPEFWVDEKLTECSLSARLLFIGSFNFADDNGNMVASAKRLKMQVFPADSIDVQPLVDELIAHGLLIEYSVNGKKYWHIKGFKKHQKINRPSNSDIPQPQLSEGSVSDHEGIIDGREGKGKERNNNKPAGEKPARSSSGAVEIKTFLANHKAADEKPIPPDDPIFDYASETGIPQEFLRLCWLEFVERNQASGKRQKDWRAAFRNCVRGNWYKLWWIDGADYCLTTTGKQAEAKHGSTGRAA